MTLAAAWLEVWSAAWIRASWQGGLAVLIVAVICRVWPGIPARFQALLWRLAIAKFAVALVWVVPIEVPLLARVEPWSKVVTSEAPPAAFPSAASLPATHVSTNELPPGAILFAIWATVAVAQWYRTGCALRAAQLLRRRCRRSRDRALLRLAERLGSALGLAQLPQILETRGSGSPYVVGIWHPAIVIPSATLAKLNESERSVVLGHELAHIARGDLLWSFIAAIVRACFWFHPWAWFCERRLGQTQEIAADAWAITRQDHDPVRYATQLVSIVAKLGSTPEVVPMSLGIATLQRSLHERLFAMRFLSRRSSRCGRWCNVGIVCCALLGAVPWTFVATAALAAEATLVVDAAAQLEAGKGKFVSFTNGVLTIDGMLRPSATHAGGTGLIAWKNVDEKTKTYVAAGEDTGPDRGYKPAKTLEALQQAKPGTLIFVGPWFGYKDRPGVFVGINPSRSVGTFVSYTSGSKNSGLTLLGKNLAPGSFTKKYGNNLFIRGIPEDTPVEESIDGGPYQPVGTVKSVLKDVKEGTLVTVHFYGEGNITLIQLGAAPTK